MVYKKIQIVSKTGLHQSSNGTEYNLQNLNHNLLEETGRVNSLLSSIKSMEDEINNLLEKIRSGNEEEKYIELELETPKTCFLQKALCQLQNLQVVDDVNLRARFQSIQDRKLNWATEGALDV